MARSDLILSLVRAGATGDKTMLRSSVAALVAEERAKSHTILADRLEKASQAIPITPPPFNPSSNIRNDGKDIILEVTPSVQLNDLILTLPAKNEAKQLIEEHLRADILRASGFEPRHRVLLSGPPGNGKTSYAEAIAEGLSLPLFIVRYDALIGSYLGETNTRLRNLFDYVRTRPCVLFFDEFDSIGKERGDTHETGEIKRVVSFLLMQLDQLPSYVLTIAATNHAELLDRAVWRRFQSKIAFPAPAKSGIAELITRSIDKWPCVPKTSPQALASLLDVNSYSEARDFCQNVRRRHILGLGEVGIDVSIEAELELWAARVKPELDNAHRSEQAPSKSASRERTAKKARSSR